MRRDGDRSPALSPEQKRKHDLEAEKVNYKVALDELSLYMGRSTLQPSPDRRDSDERAWKDHRGRVWVTKYPIDPEARHELDMILEILCAFEEKYPDKSSEEQLVNEMANVRATGHEPGNNRLEHFQQQLDQSDPANPIPNWPSERMPKHDPDIER